MISKSDVKYIQSLSHKKFRDEAGEFVVEGVKMLDELMENMPGSIQRIFATTDWIQRHNKKGAIPVSLHEVEEFELKKISSLSTPNDVLAVVKKPIFAATEIDYTGLVLVLDGIQDPGNLGTIVRTCDWFGVSDLVCSMHTADVFNPKVVQASMGSIMRVRTHYMDLISFFKANTFKTVYAAVMDGININTIKLTKPSILVIGNESKGVGAELTPFITTKITIPRSGMAESLNAAVAASILVSRVTS
jgi:TrmH family RNA methyltransferase